MKLFCTATSPVWLSAAWKVTPRISLSWSRCTCSFDTGTGTRCMSFPKRSDQKLTALWWLTGNRITQNWKLSLVTCQKDLEPLSKAPCTLCLFTPITRCVRWESSRRQNGTQTPFMIFSGAVPLPGPMEFPLSHASQPSVISGVVQHLQNGQLLRDIYLKKHRLLPNNWSTDQLYLETTGKSRTLQSGLALLYGFLPDFDWKKIHFRHQPSALFCSGNCYCPLRNQYLEKEQRRQYLLRLKNSQLERTYEDMARIVDVPTKQLRAANPIDSMLCHFCHNVSFPCTRNGCIDMEHFKVIKTHQIEDERERREKKLYVGYALLGAHPILNQTITRMQRAAEGRKEEVFALYSAHDVTLSPVLSALGLTEARFPRFAARLIFELWQDREKPSEHSVRILYNGVDVTFHTSFCQDHHKHSSKSMCPLENLVRFVKRDMFVALGSSTSTNYYDACHREGF
uniref:2-phosphoxylose phosphatase 1 n=1 Tax=Suricata suricatta TaxID=37032 RepID=A0A673TAK6_SURSU